MAEWSSAGYDMAKADRGLYLFLDRGPGLVKLGLVLEPDRVDGRLRQVSGSKKYPRPDLECVARSVLHGVTHPEAEHIEAVARHWLCNARGFAHAGLVDWLEAPAGPEPDWQRLLDQAATAATNFGKNARA